MCRNIHPLFNFEPPATDEEVRAASLQFVRKISGFTKPSQANAAVFEAAVDDVAAIARRLVDSLSTMASARNWPRGEGRAAPNGSAGERTRRDGRRCELGSPPDSRCRGPLLVPPLH